MVNPLVPQLDGFHLVFVSAQAHTNRTGHNAQHGFLPTGLLHHHRTGREHSLGYDAILKIVYG